MKPALAVIHGGEDETCRRIRALSGDRPLVAGMSPEVPGRLAVAYVDDIDAEALEALARGVRANEDFFIVHLIPSLQPGASLDVPALMSGLSDAQARLQRQFPVATLVQWCVLQAGRDLDPLEAALLSELHDRRESLGLRGTLVVPTSTSQSIAGDAQDSRAYAADVVYSLLRGSLQDSLPGITAVATTSVTFRAREMALALAGQLAAEHIRTDVTRPSDPTEDHAQVGRADIQKLELAKESDALLARSTSESLILPVTIKDVLPRDRPDVVLAHAEETALVTIPEVMTRARSAVPQRLELLQSAVLTSLTTYLCRVSRTRATQEYLRGVRAQLDKSARDLADAADGVDAPAVDALYHEAVQAALKVPSRGATAVRGTGLALLPLAAVLLPGLPWASIPLVGAAALAAAGMVLAAGARSSREHHARKALVALQNGAERRAAGLMERGALLLVRDMVKDLAEWVGDTAVALDEAPGATTSVAEQLRELHSAVNKSADVMAARSDSAAAYPDLEPSRFALVFPDPEPLLSEGASPQVQHAIAEAREKIRGVFKTWALGWTRDDIVMACLRVGANPILDQLPHSLAQALDDEGPTTEAVKSVLSCINQPRLRSYENAGGTGEPWRWVFVAPELSNADWLPRAEADNFCDMDDPGFVAVLNLMTLQIEALRSIAQTQSAFEADAGGGDGTDFVVKREDGSSDGGQVHV